MMEETLPMNASSGSAAPTVLVVEDDPQVLQSVSWALEDAGFAVEMAQDGQAGWEHLERTRPALVVLDWHLPWLDSDDFVVRLRQLYDNQVPVVLMSADPGVATKALEIGAAGFAEKPLDLEQFAALVRQLVEQ
jgi:DNA-binding response OmpR family regulator